MPEELLPAQVPEPQRERPGTALANVRESIELLKLKRREAELRRQIIEEWVSWAAQKTTGVGCLIIGSLQLLHASFLPPGLPDPWTVIGIGSGLVLGKNFVALLARIAGK